MKNLLIILALFVTVPAMAQTEPAIRSDGYFASYFTFEFKPGKTDEGLEILKQSLLPAFRKTGVKVTLIEDLLGTKDVMAIIQLKDGPRYFEQVMPAQDQKLFEELIRLTGSPEQAEAALDSFINLLAKQSQKLVFVPDM